MVNKTAIFRSFSPFPLGLHAAKTSNSFIKGYHIYKIRLHPCISMDVKRDVSNKYDEFAMHVIVPEAKELKVS